MEVEDTAINEVKAYGQEVRKSNFWNRMNPGVSANCDPIVYIRLREGWIPWIPNSIAIGEPIIYGAF